MSMDQLSQRESEVFELAALGLSNDEIAGRLDISRRTVETHLRTVFHKTGVTRRAQLVALANEGGPPRATPSPMAAEPAAPGKAPDLDARRLGLYETAVRRLVARQFPLFEEQVEITLTVGGVDGRDSVVERHHTTPKPYLAYRVLRPIMARTQGPPVDIDELQLTCDLHGQDVQTDLNPMLDADGRPLMLVMFQPGLETPTEWTLRYRAPQLWDPLRRTGVDSLRWAPGTLDQRHRPNIDDLTFHVVFPATWAEVGLTERDGLGTIRTERIEGGRNRVTWHDGTPLAPEYNLELRGRAGD